MMHSRVAHRAHTAAIYGLVIGLGPKEVWSVGGDGMVLSWAAGLPNVVTAIAQLPGAAYCIHVDRSRSFLIAGTGDGELHLVDIAARNPVQRIKAHTKGIYSIIALHGNRIACAGGDGVLSIWRFDADTEPGTGRYKAERSIPLCEVKLRDLAVDKIGRSLAVACGDGSVRVLDTIRFNEFATCDGHQGGTNCVAFHPSKPVLLSGGKDGQLRAWKADAHYQPLVSVAAHRSTIYRMAFDHTGDLLATASRDKSVKLWDARTLSPLQRFEAKDGGHSHSVNAILWDKDALYSAGDDRHLIAWST